jgi:Tfp pilus assembly protein PilZ
MISSGPMLGLMDEHHWGTEARLRWDFVSFRSKSARGEGCLTNVSETGVFVRTDYTPNVGEEVHVILESARPPLALHGRVRWIGRRHDGVGGFGVILGDPPKEYVELVRSIVSSPHEEGPQPVSPRLALAIPVSIEHGASHQEGTLSNLSLSGARLDHTGSQPPLGSQVTLLFSLKGCTRPFEIVARVVRLTDLGGYAVQFEASDSALEQALQQAVSVLPELN